MFDERPEIYTWKRSDKIEADSSYIDYFLFKNMDISDFVISKRIGTSDHYTLNAVISNLCIIKC